MKKYKATDILWATSVVIITIVAIILSVTSIIEYNLPMAVRIICGVLDFVAVIVLVFTTVKKFIDNKRKNN
ncbi:MAG: hypothetical protein K2H36_04850 [Clostridia bacterium]|nr:hypothetical protein [Clostridia bacterium]